MAPEAGARSRASSAESFCKLRIAKRFCFDPGENLGKQKDAIRVRGKVFKDCFDAAAENRIHDGCEYRANQQRQKVASVHPVEKTADNQQRQKQQPQAEQDAEEAPDADSAQPISDSGFSRTRKLSPTTAMSSRKRVFSRSSVTEP